MTSASTGSRWCGLLAATWLVPLVAGCTPERPHSTVLMTQGTASYEATPAGVSAAGSFTLLVSFPEGSHSHGAESDVYLHRLQLNDGYGYEFEEWTPEIEELSADRPLPFVATVGDETAVTFAWSTDQAATFPSELCSARLLAEIYLSLGDELTSVYLDTNAYYPDQRLVWSPDPCSH